MSKEDKGVSGFKSAVDHLVDDVEALKKTLPLMMAVLTLTRRQARKELDEYVAERDIETRKDNGKTTYTVEQGDFSRFDKLLSRVDSASVAGRIVPRSLLVSLVSQFDAFLGRLIQAIFTSRPEILEASERQMSFADLTQFETLQDARSYIIEKEVESVLRKSHTKHFDWLEHRLKMPLRKDLAVWPTFVELTERRNLFVHADGVVSRQYLAVCAENGVRLEDDVVLGRQLSVSGAYFHKACDCVQEIGIKLAHVCWRKLASDERKEADNDLNNKAFKLIVDGDYDLALELLRFGTEVIKTHHSEEMKLYMLINRAQAYKWKGDADECKALLGSIDWSAKGNHLRLARAVLSDDMDEAVRLVRSLGAGHRVMGKEAYASWPLFRELRETEEFREAYRDVFDEEFRIEEEDMSGAGGDDGEDSEGE